MAGWTDSSAAASGTGGGGWRFTSHSTSGGANNRWRERGRGRPPSQPHYRYRPANSDSNSNPNPNPNARPSSPTLPHHHSGPAMGHRGQGASSTSTRRSQPARLPLTDKSPLPAASAIMPPADAMQPDDKANRNAANFECNVCFDMAADPVVTKCGHLFCWECLHQWLHVHSHHRECPVCKGQVADDAIIPIYGRGGSAAALHTAPPRPTGARVESYRQQQAAEPDLPMDDDEDDDPFDLQEIRLGFGVGSLRDAMPMMTLMPGQEVDLEQHYYHGYTNANNYDDDLLGFPVFASAGSGSGSGSGSSQGHGVGDDLMLMEAFFNSDMDTHHPPALGTNHQNRGRHGRRQRARAGAGAADHSSTDGMVMGGSGAFYRNTGAFPNVARGGSSRLYGGWTERGGRSNRNSRDAARIASRRQRANYD